MPLKKSYIFCYGHIWFIITLSRNISIIFKYVLKNIHVQLPKQWPPEFNVRILIGWKFLICCLLFFNCMYTLSKIGFRIILLFIDTTECRLQNIFRVIVLTFEILQYVFSWKNQIAIYLFEQLPNAILEKK